MKDTLLFPHLGLGDLIVCNALVRQLALKRKVWVMVRPNNAESARFMWRDNTNIELLALTGSFDEQEQRAKEFFGYAQKQGKETLGLGFWGTKPFETSIWDQEFYRQAGMDFRKTRWTEFKVARQESREFPVPGKRYIFVHEDAKRGHLIDPTRLPKNRKIVKAEPLPAIDGSSPCIFDWWKVIEFAEEIHCMESCFACLIDSLPFLKAKRLVLHEYTRKSTPPTYCMNWERIR